MQLSIKLQAKDNVLRFCHEIEAKDIYIWDKIVLGKVLQQFWLLFYLCFLFSELQISFVHFKSYIVFIFD
jgi:hypothetical protein